MTNIPSAVKRLPANRINWHTTSGKEGEWAIEAKLHGRGHLVDILPARRRPAQILLEFHSRQGKAC
jgi:hypothetical protein